MQVNLHVIPLILFENPVSTPGLDLESFRLGEVGVEDLRNLGEVGVEDFREGVDVGVEVLRARISGTPEDPVLFLALGEAVDVLCTTK